MTNEAKVGVRVGQTAPAGTYQWTVFILSWAYDEARKILDADQYEYAVSQIMVLATEADPTHSVLCSVDAIEDFYELREKHGVLGKINLRVFFHLDRERRAIVLLGAFKKENNGPTPDGTRVTMRRRKRLYCEGAVSVPQTSKNNPGK